MSHDEDLPFPPPPDPADAANYRELRRRRKEYEASLTDEQREARARDAEQFAKRIVGPLYRALEDMKARLEEHTDDEDEED